MPSQKPQIEKKEFLTLPYQVKAVGEPDADGYVGFSGYAAAFNNVDLGNDVILEGAFSETIKADPNVPIYTDHNPSIGTTVGFNLAASEDQKGLAVEGQINTNVPAGKTVFELMKQALKIGKQIGLSIGYGTQEKEYDPDTNVRTLKKLKLYEYSFTNHPMNTLATATSLKAMEREELKSALLEIMAEDPDFFTKTAEEEISPNEDKSDCDWLDSLSKLNQKVESSKWNPKQ